MRDENKHITFTEMKDYIMNQMGISVGKSTLSDILKDSNRWLDCRLNNLSRFNPEKYPEFEEALFIWGCQVNASHGTLTDDIIINKAKQFAHKIDD